MNCRLLHIGPTKTGTTALQGAMRRQRKELIDLGVYYPKGRGADRSLALRALLRAIREGRGNEAVPEWESFLSELDAASDRRVMVSHEVLAKLSQPVAKRVADDLRATHVVAAARRYDEFLPSQWQQLVKTGATLLPFEKWLEQQLDPERDTEETRLWRSHDTVGLARRWSEFVPDGNLYVIALDEADRQLVPRTFEQLLDLPRGTLDLSKGSSNTSLTFHETEIMRSAFVTMAEAGVELRQPVRQVVRKALLESRSASFAQPAHQELPSRPPLPAWAIAEIEVRSVALVRALATMPIRIIGDPASLLVHAADITSAEEWEAWEDQRLAAHRAGAALAAAVLGARAGSGLSNELEDLSDSNAEADATVNARDGSTAE